LSAESLATGLKNDYHLQTNRSSITVIFPKKYFKMKYKNNQLHKKFLKSEDYLCYTIMIEAIFPSLKSLSNPILGGQGTSK